MIVPFRVTDKSMLSHLERQQNRSEYLRSLIRADMDIAKVQFNVQQAVESTVAERLKELMEAGAIVLGGGGNGGPEVRRADARGAERLVRGILEL